MAVAALIVSIFALVVSGLSLGWQVYSWRRTGPVVSLKTEWAAIAGGQPDETYVVIHAYNEGRSPVLITGWHLDTPNGYMIVKVTPSSYSTPLNRPLEGGSSATWYMDADEVRKEAERLGTRIEDLQARVTLGNGSFVRARQKGIGNVR